MNSGAGFLSNLLDYKKPTSCKECTGRRGEESKKRTRRDMKKRRNKWEKIISDMTKEKDK